MGGTEPCHGVLDEQAHRVSSPRVQFKPIPVEDARELILQICTQRDTGASPSSALGAPRVWVCLCCPVTRVSGGSSGDPQV